MLLRAQVITGEVTKEEYDRLWATNMTGSFGLSKRLATVINEGALGHMQHIGTALLGAMLPSFGGLHCLTCTVQWLVRLGTSRNAQRICETRPEPQSV